MRAIAKAGGTSRGGGNLFDFIADGIRRDGYVVVDEIFSAAEINALAADCHHRLPLDFKLAGVGRGDDFQINPFVRRDEICWLDLSATALAAYRGFVENLRRVINRELLLGLFDYECHYARYAVGAFYGKHVDAFRGQSNRRLSTVLYLNRAWQPADGGELLLYRADQTVAFLNVAPVWGRMVFFLSEEFPHEVKPARRERISIAGWYRVNALDGFAVHPPP